MPSLQTRFMGLSLEHPIIAGASDLSANVDSVKRLAEAGAGAIVLKSLFEEQIQLERYQLEEELRAGSEVYAEMASIFPKMEHAGPKEHLLWVKKAKEAVKVPIIASLNAVEQKTWVEYSKMLADQGVDGLELNFFATPRDFSISGAQIEEEQIRAAHDVRRAVKIPFAVKLSAFYSNPLNFCSRLDAEGVDGLVLFNRYFQPDIDVESESMKLPFNFSTAVNSRLPLRYAGLLYGKIKSEVCASTGIVTGKDVAKMILAGASAVQVVTALYKRGINSLSTMKDELAAWMDGKKYGSIADFQGKLSEKNAEDPWAYTRAQYARMLLNPKQFAEPVRS